tara:strand:- start:413 stop:883 length:471 start_codon:yes stop_codon:yes gene_type:complete
MRTVLVLLSILVIQLGSAPVFSQTTVSHGEWMNADGSSVSMPCPSSYLEITRLPSGCVNRLPGGGLLWTPKAHSGNSADLSRASRIIDGLKINLEKLRSEFDSAVKAHKEEISKISDDAIKNLDEIKSSHSSSVLRSFFHGFGAGVILSAIIVLSI